MGEEVLVLHDVATVGVPDDKEDNWEKAADEGGQGRHESVPQGRSLQRSGWAGVASCVALSRKGEGEGGREAPTH